MRPMAFAGVLAILALGLGSGTPAQAEPVSDAADAAPPTRYDCNLILE